MNTQRPPTYIVFDWVIVGHVAVSRALPGEIPNELWNQFLSEMATKKCRYVLALVFGSPSLSATQRKAAADVLKEKGIFAAVITESALVRGIVTAVSWLGAKGKSFSWNEVDAAVTLCEVVGTPLESKLRTAIDEFVKRRDASGVKA